MKKILFPLILLFVNTCSSSPEKKPDSKLYDSTAHDVKGLRVVVEPRNDGFVVGEKVFLNHIQMLQFIKSKKVHELFMNGGQVKHLLCLASIAGFLKVKLNVIKATGEISPISTVSSHSPQTTCKMLFSQ